MTASNSKQNLENIEEELCAAPEETENSPDAVLGLGENDDFDLLAAIKADVDAQNLTK